MKSKIIHILVILTLLIVCAVFVFAIPNILISHPINNTIYPTSLIDLNWTIDITPNWCTYSLDNGNNNSFLCYQENANESSTCGVALNEFYDNSTNAFLGRDGNTSTKTEMNVVNPSTTYPTSNNSFNYANWTIPNDALNGKIQLEIEGSGFGFGHWKGNATIPTICFDNAVDNKIQIRAGTYKGWTFTTIYDDNGNIIIANPTAVLEYVTAVLCKVEENNWSVMTTTPQQLTADKVNGYWEDAMWWIIPNITTLNVSDGPHNVTIYCDNGSIGSDTIYNFSVDLTYPQIDWSTLSSNGTTKSQSYIESNVTWTETNFANITWNINGTTTIYSVPTYEHNETGLGNGTYYYNVTICDIFNKCNSTDTRQITLDTISPTINILYPIADAFYNLNYLNLNWTFNENLGWCAYRLDGGENNSNIMDIGIPISNCLELNNTIRTNLSGNYFLTNNIDCSDTINWDGGFTPIGEFGSPFAGNLNGHGYNITNLFTNQSNGYGGLIGRIDDSSTNVSIENLGMIDALITESTGFGYCALISIAQANNNANIYINNVEVSGTITGCYYSGGILGYMDTGDDYLYINNVSSTVSIADSARGGGLIGRVEDTAYIGVNNSFANVTIFGAHVGGIAGEFPKGYIMNTESHGIITGTGSGNGNIAGGLVGYFKSSNTIQVDNCFSTAIVNITNVGNYAGGFTGLAKVTNANDWINNSYATGKVTGNSYVGGFVGYCDWCRIFNSYSTGNVTGSSSFGGFSGTVGGTYVINNSVWDNQTSGQSTSAADAIPKTTAMMQTQSNFTELGWNFDKDWYMNGYPVLNKSTWSVLEYNTISFNYQNITLTGLSDGPHNVTIYCNDVAGNLGSDTVLNFSIDTTSPSATLLEPANNSLVGPPSQNLTVNLTDNLNIKNATVYVYNSSDDLINETTTIVGGTTQKIVGTVVNFMEGIFKWFYRVFDSAEHSYDTENRTLIINSFPEISSVILNSTNNATNDNLTGYITSSDINSNNITYSYNWYKDGILNATSLILNGLVAYYSMNNDSYDYYGDNDGTNYGAILTTGKINKAYNFNGSNYILADNFAEIGKNKNYSVSFWIYPLDTYSTGFGRAIWQNSHGSSDRNGMNRDGSTLRFGYYNGSSWVSKSSSILNNQWTHVVGTLEDGIVSLYINGVNQTGTSSAYVSTSSTNFYLGEDSTTTAKFNGSIDEFTIYSRTLSESEVQQLYYGSVYGGDIMDSSKTSELDNWTLGVKSMDYLNISGETNSTTLKILDLIYPTIEWSSLTEEDGANKSQTYIELNVTWTENNFQNITLNINGTEYTNTTAVYKWNETGLGEGIYYYNVTICDTSGNCNNTLTRQITLDTTLPIVNILHPVNDTIYDSNIQDLNYTASDLNLDFCQYSLDEGVNTTISSNISIGPLLDDNHNITIYCSDYAGNIGQSDLIEFEISTALTILIVYPIDSSFYNSSSIDYNWTVDGTFDTCQYELDSNGTNISISSNITLTSLTDGLHNLTMWCNDTSGNISQAPYISFTTDITDPTATLLTPTNNSLVSTPQNLTVNLTDNIEINYTTLFVYNSSDNLINETTTTIGSVTQKIVGTVINFANGIYKWFYRVFDSSGNSADTANWTINIDAINPSSEILFPINNTSYNYSTLNINYTASDTNLDTCLYSLDGASNITASNLTLYNQSETTHNVTLFCNDTVGNKNISTTYYTIDLPPPNIEVSFTTPTTPVYGNSVFIDSNISIEDGGEITSVDFTVLNHVGGTVISGNGNDLGNKRWISDNFTAEGFTGYFNWTITATSSDGNTTESSGSFFVADTFDYAPSSFTFTPDPRNETQVFIVKLWHDSLETDWNYTMDIMMENTSCFIPSLNESSFVLGDTTIDNAKQVEATIEINCSPGEITDGLYYGNITINRTYNSTIKVIPVAIGINPPAGDVEAYDTVGNRCNGPDLCDVSSTIDSDDSISKTWIIGNTGGFNLTECIPTLTNDYDGKSFFSFDKNNFSIENGTNTTLKVTISNAQAGTYDGFLDITCKATVFGFENSLSEEPENQPIIQLIVTQASAPVIVTGGGGGSVSRECIVNDDCLIYGTNYYCLRNKCILNTTTLLPSAFETCNYNGICEPDLGESWFNCRCDLAVGCGVRADESGDCSFSLTNIFGGEPGQPSPARFLVWISIAAIILTLFLFADKLQLKQRYKIIKRRLR